MFDHESGEIRRHAAVGGAIAVFLAAFHIFETWLLNFVKSSSSWPRVAGLGFGLLTAAFCVAFAAIWLIEAFWRKIQEGRRIPVPRIGIVDGLWIEAIIENGEVSQGSKVTIESASAAGFSVSGTSYEVDVRGDLAPTAWGGFRGRHGTLFPSSGISYVYDGEQAGARHFGVVYQEFRIQEENGRTEIYFDGAFLARERNAVHLVIGRRISRELPDSDVHTLLQEFVNRHSVREFARTGTVPAAI